MDKTPTSWNDFGMDWTNPDVNDSIYAKAIIEACKERCFQTTVLSSVNTEEASKVLNINTNSILTREDLYRLMRLVNSTVANFINMEEVLKLASLQNIPKLYYNYSTIPQSADLSIYKNIYIDMYNILNKSVYSINMGLNVIKNGYRGKDSGYTSTNPNMMIDLLESRLVPELDYSSDGSAGLSEMESYSAIQISHTDPKGYKVCIKNEYCTLEIQPDLLPLYRNSIIGYLANTIPFSNNDRPFSNVNNEYLDYDYSSLGISSGLSYKQLGVIGDITSFKIGNSNSVPKYPEITNLSSLYDTSIKGYNIEFRIVYDFKSAGAFKFVN